MRLKLLLATAATVLAPAAAAHAEIVADSGFRPQVDGFSFPNYGSEYPGLTSLEMRDLYGDRVCARPPLAGEATCVLTPPAQEFADEINESTAGGHCFGMSVLALRLRAGDPRPERFGAPTTFGLSPVSNPTLTGEISRAFVAQIFPSVLARTVDSPGAVLETLRDDLADGSETWTLAIFNRDADGGLVDGHGITPFALDVRDDHTDILAYDNNYPSQTRVVRVGADGSWRYPAEGDPSYVAKPDEKQMRLYPTTPGLGRQPCPFCDDQKRSVEIVVPAPDAPGRPEPEEVTVPGRDATPAAPGVCLDDTRFSVAAGRPLRLDVTTPRGGGRRGTGRLSVRGGGWSVSADGLNRGSGRKDTLRVSPDGTHVRLLARRGRTVAPRLTLTTERDTITVRIARTRVPPGGARFAVRVAGGRVQVTSPSRSRVTITPVGGAVQR